MRNPHPSWPTPLLAMGPVRLRPMGWLDDLLPLRPPSLWDGKSLYARSLRWQPDTADLSWLFDAYAMLGIEMPPPRIEHRSHQRTQRRMGAQSGRQQLRRQRAPIKGGKRPLVVPQWSKDQTMRGPAAPQKGRVDTTQSVSLARKRTAGLPNVPNFQWRSPSGQGSGAARVTPNVIAAPTFLQGPATPDKPENLRSTAPVETGNRQSVEAPQWKRPKSTQPQMPNVASQPTTLLRPAERVEAPPVTSTSTPRTATVLPNQRPATQNLAPVQREQKNTSALIQRVPASRLPPKVTWKPTHQQSPWRLHPSKNPDTEQRSASAKSGLEAPNRAERQPVRKDGPQTPETRWRLPSQRPLGEQAQPWRVERAVSLSDMPASRAEDGLVNQENRARGKTTNIPVMDRSGQRWRLQHSSQMTQASMILQPMATVQRQFLDAGPIEKTDATTVSRPSISPNRQATTVSRPSTVSRKPSSSTTKPIQSSPSRAQVGAQSAVTPPLVNWRPAIQPVRWRLMRTGASTVDEATQTSRIAPPQVVPPPKRRPESAQVESPAARPIRSTESSPNSKIRRVTKPSVQVPARVPWRLQPRTVNEVQAVTVSDLLPTLVQPTAVDQASETLRAPSERTLDRRPPRSLPPRISNWHPPKRQDLITHFRRPVALRAPEVTQATKTVQSVDAPTLNRAVVSPIYSFDGGTTGTIFKAQDRTMVMPLQAGTMVFPTPEISSDPERKVSEKSEPVQKERPQKGGTVEVVPAAKVQRVEDSANQRRVSKDANASVGSEVSASSSLKRYPASYVQLTDGYQRRRIASTIPLLARSFGPFDPAKPQQKQSSVLSALGERVDQPRWRLPQVSYTTQSVPTLTTSTTPVGISRPVWSAQTQWQPQQRTQTQLLIPADLESKRVSQERSLKSVSASVTQGEATQRQSAARPTASAKPKTVEPAIVNRSRRQPKTPSLHQDVSWQKRSVVLPSAGGASTTRTNEATPLTSTSKQVAKGSPERIQQVSWRLPPRFADPFQRQKTNNVGYTGGAQSSVLARQGTVGAVEPAATNRQVRALGLSPALVYQPAANEQSDSEQLRQVRPEPAPEIAQDSVVKATAVELRSADVKQVVQTFEKQVRRLPRAQQSLLRSQIALPSQWVNRLAQGSSIFKPVRAATARPVSTPLPTMMTSSSSELLLTPSSQAMSDSTDGTRPQPTRALTSSQVNRIVERQVAFFRSAQRQSFLRGSQLGGGSTGVPSPARQGLQSVTQDMRQALQRMVLSTAQEQILLDAVEQRFAEESRPQQKRNPQGSSSNSTTQPVPKGFKGISKRRIRPTWRPTLNTAQPTSRPSTPIEVAREAVQEVYLDSVSEPAVEPAQKVSPTMDEPTPVASPKRPVQSRGRNGMIQPMRMMGQSEVGVFLRPKKEVPVEELPKKPSKQDPTKIDKQSEVIMIDPSGKLLTGQAATKRLTEMGFARTETTKKEEPSVSTSGSYTWEAPPDMMADVMQQVRQQMVSEQEQEVVIREGRKRGRPRQSVIKEWTEEQLLSILVELSSDSPEANALLRDVQERVEEIVDLDRFRRI